jgi:hypothetical protein
MFPRKELQECCILKLNVRGCETASDVWGKVEGIQCEKHAEI